MIPANKFLSLSPDEITPQTEEEFFSSLKLRNGTYKTTFPQRFSEINKELLRFIKSGQIDVDRVMDIGISSGSNTLELCRELESANCISQIVGTDLMVDAYLVGAFPGCIALMDNTGYPLRYDILKWTMKPWVVRGDYRNGFFILRKCINLALGYRARTMMARTRSARVRKVELITPMLRKHASVAVQRDDITRYNDRFDGQFNFIRAANVLNKSYFPEASLVAILDNIRRYLVKPRGTLLVVRTHANGINHGTMFQIEVGGECTVLQRFGLGSEIEELVLQRMGG